jgi:hypothetical protein
MDWLFVSSDVKGPPKACDLDGQRVLVSKTVRGWALWSSVAGGTSA